ncbi:hypothetical protein BB561_003385 [Smittium simulii]|uniref:Uncharacterized protein n=1 Tax=Smittium simulii TaxID=133385 RepID=A0A2T9YLM7_9FUNG|nr:hypothetical protein BB561_003385 [Smittium simulii]
MVNLIIAANTTFLDLILNSMRDSSAPEKNSTIKISKIFPRTITTAGIAAQP